MIGGVLLASGTSHLLNPYQFLENVLSYELLAVGAAKTVAVVLPTTEFATGLLLVCRVGQPTAALSSLVLSLTFVVAQVTALFRGLEIDCGCFGSLAAQPIGPRSVMLAIAMLSGSALLMFQKKDASQLAANDEIAHPV